MRVALQNCPVTKVDFRMIWGSFLDFSQNWRWRLENDRYEGGTPDLSTGLSITLEAAQTLAGNDEDPWLRKTIQLDA